MDRSRGVPELLPVCTLTLSHSPSRRAVAQLLTLVVASKDNYRGSDGHGGWPKSTWGEGADARWQPNGEVLQRWSSSVKVEGWGAIAKLASQARSSHPYLGSSSPGGVDCQVEEVQLEVELAHGGGLSGGWQYGW